LRYKKLSIGETIMGFWNKNNDEDKQPVEQEEEPEEEEIEIYDVDITCYNCESSESYEIPMGKSVKDYFKNKKCNNCGCQLMEGE